MIRRPLLALLLFALSPLALAAPAAPAPVEGTDYEVIADGRPFAPVKGKVELVEVFGYTCPHCAHFQPQLDAWLARQPRDLNFVALAAPFGGYWTPYAKAYYAAETLGVAKRSHAAMFAALHEEGSLPLRNATAAEIAPFYARYGVDPARFLAAFDGPAVQERMRRADEFIRRSGVEATPTLVVNGKYRVTGRSLEDNLRIAEALIARERAAR